MMPNGEERIYPHILLSGHGDREDFTSPLRGRKPDLPPRDRADHAARLKRDLATALEAANNLLASRDPDIAAGEQGFYLEFEIPKEHAEAVEKLENRQGRSAIELVAVRPSEHDPESHVCATVFVPVTRKDLFSKKVEDYEINDHITYEKGPDKTFLLDQQGNPIEKSRSPKNNALVASIDSVRLGKVKSLYTDPLSSFPEAFREQWWEIWLRAGTRPVLEHAAGHLNITLRDHAVRFAEREIILALATPESLGILVTHTDAVAELRLNRDTPAIFMEMVTTEQHEWTEEIFTRLHFPLPNVPAVCVLDSGCARTHPLIGPLLRPEDHHAWRPDWHPHDTGQWRGHGTQMSGLALYGDLTPILVGAQTIQLEHCLESVKILPGEGQNEPELYGAITASAVSRAEIAAAQRKRVFCLAVTAADEEKRGRPSAWSAKIDDLAFGEGSDQRLFFISAGNIRDGYPAVDYLHINDASGIESPAQAWNAITVGAMTDRRNISDPSLVGWAPLAHAGDLNPSSRTSGIFEKDWPIKPEVVFEGGNQVINPASQQGEFVDDLALLTTSNRLQERYWDVTGDTSAATALVSRMGAQLVADRPEIWPETVRGLIIHSAQWTPAMLSHVPSNIREWTPRNKRLLLRRYGYGVPDLDRALRSTTNDVTLVVENFMQPFQANGSTIKSRDMILHDFPWPREELEALGETPVSMQVTLSYFIEPNPGERGWRHKHKYASHGLRFAVKKAEEGMEAFRRRINLAAREEEEEGSYTSSDEGWTLGSRLWTRGSIHRDTWNGLATDLASRHAIAVYPVGGWWRYKPYLRRGDRVVRYSLIVSLKAEVSVDLYSSIQNLVAPEVEIEIATDLD